MFDDVKKGEKIKSKRKSKTTNYEKLKKKKPIKSKIMNYEQPLN